MSYLWMEHYLEEEDLKSAFENAVTNNDAYLIHFGTSTNDFACVCDEHTQSASNNTVKDIITKNYNRHDNLRVINVYDTSLAFEKAVMAVQPPAIKQTIDDIEHEYAMANRPLWKKLLDIAP